MGTLVRLAALGGLAYAVKRYVDSNPDTEQRLRDAGGHARAELRRTTRPVRDRAGSRFGAVEADDATVAARVRSQLGPLERRLDVPRVQVTVTDGQVTLRGWVPTAEAGRTLGNAAREVRGVTGLESHLSVGRRPDTTQPSEGRSAHAVALPAGV